MFLLLVACGAIYMALGDRHEALMLLGFVFVVMGITFVQQRRSERSLEALRDLSSPRALVVRDGQTAADRRARAGLWRHRAAGRGRPRAGRHAPARVVQPGRGRIAVDG